jgi:predicted nucleic acid-binding protein
LLRVLVDTDVILDFLLKRLDFVDAAQAIWEANRAGQFEGYISAVMPVNVFYLARKYRGADMARHVMGEHLTL